MDENAGHVKNVTTLIRHATSVTYKVESIFEADTIVPQVWSEEK